MLFRSPDDEELPDPTEPLDTELPRGSRDLPPLQPVDPEVPRRLRGRPRVAGTFPPLPPAKAGTYRYGGRDWPIEWKGMSGKEKELAERSAEQRRADKEASGLESAVVDRAPPSQSLPPVLRVTMQMGQGQARAKRSVTPRGSAASVPPPPAGPPPEPVGPPTRPPPAPAVYRAGKGAATVGVAAATP